jgi:Asp-tRNA(Asn)/Glu-tRNA(Gln) amidotransferase A subunit family amidase
LQIVGRRRRDDVVLSVGAALERALELPSAPASVSGTPVKAEA